MLCLGVGGGGDGVSPTVPGCEVMEVVRVHAVPGSGRWWR